MIRVSAHGTRVSRRKLFSVGASAVALIGAAGCKKTAPESCSGAGVLAPDAIQLRKALEYADRAPSPDKTCERCQQWIEPSSKDQCGGCKVIPGPIHPLGYCKVFVSK